MRMRKLREKVVYNRAKALKLLPKFVSHGVSSSRVDSTPQNEEMQNPALSALFKLVI
jgi:hypothetical protein